MLVCAFFGAELAADGQCEEEGDDAEAGDEDDDEWIHALSGQPVALRSWRPSLR